MKLSEQGGKYRITDRDEILLITDDKQFAENRLKYLIEGEEKNMFNNMKEGPVISLNLQEVPLIEALDRVEREIYKYAIEHTKYNQSKAAVLIGVSRGTLRYKLAEFFPNVYF